MKLRKILGIVVVATVAFGSVSGPARAGDSGTKGDSQRDTIDYLKHPQNSFRPPIPYDHYQYQCDGDPTQTSCTSPMDLASSRVVTDPINKKITFTMTTSKGLIPNGSPPTALPIPFVSIVYSWYFQTGHQDSRLQIGTNCLPAEYGGNLGPTSTDRVYIAKVQRHSSCPAAKILADKTTEADRIQDGTKRRPADLAPIYTTPHPRADGWWGLVSVELKAGDDGNLHYHELWGQYEGYSGFSESQEKSDAVNENLFSFSASGNTLTATIPYEPLVQGGVDDDLMIDDATVFPWPLGRVGSSITAMVAQINGTAEVGSPTPVCPFGPSFLPNVLPGVGYPQNLPGADGGTDCINGIYGLLTVRDWTDGGFELRQVPRSPAYAPSASSLSCRYPIGHFPAAPAPVTVETLGIGPQQGSIDASTSPFDENFKVGVWQESAGSPSGGTETVPSTSVGALPNPVGTVDLPLIGKDVPCQYTYVDSGLHYKDVLTPDVPM